MSPPISSVGDVRKPSVGKLAEPLNKAVIPDLVSEERAESVGNPCLDHAEVRACPDMSGMYRDAAE
jgi:hypothetical protein